LGLRHPFLELGVEFGKRIVALGNEHAPLAISLQGLLAGQLNPLRGQIG